MWQNVVAKFVYDPATHVIAHASVEFSLEQYPPLDEEVVDPLLKLRTHMSESVVEVDLVAEAQAKAAEALGR